ncbi:MAG: bifunctional demethylmenaquinone methyltransferase/2-methoxy-6-polyprenyl-1,4-benzoquinol methylase UbiE [Flavobacteriales bacterium]|jgi:demethylmenaquinone methyltransferase / 2-methoxy-6-polyprenyl-1,4-benzoquinol methylase|nr:bifunctional demethylmenaquinone methyltransferase/2-methoxy-6-polyprenyl-1,4-benzoquinol methylase UbiE [Flavobacteriales bacterium]
MSKIVKPYKTDKGKKEQVKQMFNKIAKRYDLLNHTLSLGMDFVWRRKAIKKITNNPKKILDIATGTADFAISAAKYTDANITGIDISDRMINIGEKKINKKNLKNRIKLSIADSENLPFNKSSFDAITAGFGVRNFENLEKGLNEIFRVIKKDGFVVILEPSTPKIFPLKQIFRFYFNTILPKIGTLLSDDRSAYTYLPNSVKNFPNGKEFIKILDNIGFRKTSYFPLTFGIVSLYVAIK